MALVPSGVRPVAFAVVKALFDVLGEEKAPMFGATNDGTLVVVHTKGFTDAGFTSWLDAVGAN